MAEVSRWLFLCLFVCWLRVGLSVCCCCWCFFFVFLTFVSVYRIVGGPFIDDITEMFISVAVAGFIASTLISPFWLCVIFCLFAVVASGRQKKRIKRENWVSGRVLNVGQVSHAMPAIIRFFCVFLMGSLFLVAFRFFLLLLLLVRVFFPFLCRGDRKSGRLSTFLFPFGRKNVRFFHVCRCECVCVCVCVWFINWFAGAVHSFSSNHVVCRSGGWLNHRRHTAANGGGGAGGRGQ